MKKLTARQILVDSTMRTYAHQNTIVIDSRRRVVQCEYDETERAVTQLSAAVASAKARLKTLEAQLAGIDAMVAKR